jgi:hypothetical protein
MLLSASSSVSGVNCFSCSVSSACSGVIVMLLSEFKGSTVFRLFASGESVFAADVAPITRFTARTASINAAIAAIEILIFFCILFSSKTHWHCDTLGNPWKKAEKLFQNRNKP